MKVLMLSDQHFASLVDAGKNPEVAFEILRKFPRDHCWRQWVGIAELYEALKTNVVPLGRILSPTRVLELSDDLIRELKPLAHVLTDQWIDHELDCTLPDWSLKEEEAESAQSATADIFRELQFLQRKFERLKFALQQIFYIWGLEHPFNFRATHLKDFVDVRRRRQLGFRL